MNNTIVFVLMIIFAAILGVSAVSAQENATSDIVTADTDEPIILNENELNNEMISDFNSEKHIDASLNVTGNVLASSGDKSFINTNETDVSLEKVKTNFLNLTVVSNKLSAVLVTSEEAPLPNQNVAYVIEGVQTNATTDENGLIVIENVAGKTVQLIYSGNDICLPTNVTLTVNPPKPASKLSSKFNVKSGTGINVYTVDFSAGERGKEVSFKLTDSNGNPIAGAAVKVAYKTVYFNRTADKNGIIKIGISTQIADQYLCALSYLGDESHEATFVAFFFNIQKKPISISVVSKKYKASVKTKKYTVTLKTKVCSSKNGKVYLKKGKKVTLNVNGKTFSAKTNAKGQAIFKITNLKKKGKYAATVKFAGDKTYKFAKKNIKITVK